MSCLRESGSRHEGRSAECRAQEYGLALLQGKKHDFRVTNERDENGTRTAHQTDVFDEEEDLNSEEEESDSTTVFDREMDELASAVEELGDTLDVQGVEDL